MPPIKARLHCLVQYSTCLSRICLTVVQWGELDTCVIRTEMKDATGVEETIFGEKVNYLTVSPETENSHLMKGDTCHDASDFDTIIGGRLRVSTS